ncbi:MAG: hypothetical protein QXE80_03600 [Pyrobaculum sp.]
MFDEALQKALKDLSKMRGVPKEYIINEALFWYFNFLGSRIEQISDIEFNLSEKTIEKIAERVAQKLQLAHSQCSEADKNSTIPGQSCVDE